MAGYSFLSPSPLARALGCLPLLVLSGFGSIQAAEQAAESHSASWHTAQLSPMVVTGTRTARSLETSPVRTQVIDRSTLDRQQARNLAEALRQLPGVYLRTTHGKEGQEVWMQGLDSERVLILINGVPAIASTGNSVDLTQIAITDVERIEVVRGATSALYGSSAMGGVIHIITRQTSRSGYRIQATAGTLGDQGDGDGLDRGQVQASLALAGEAIQFEAHADWRRDEGYTLRSGAFGQDGHAIEQLNLSAQLNWQHAELGRFSLRPSWLSEDKNKRQATALPGGLEARSLKQETVEQPGLQFGWQRSTPLEGEWSLNASWSLFSNVTEDRQANASRQPIMRREADIEHWRLETQWSFWWLDQQQITVGALARQETLEQFKETWGASGVQRDPEIQSGAEQTNLEVYLQNQIYLSHGIEFLPGVRYQHDSDFGSFITPSLTFFQRRHFDLGDLNQRLSFGRGYRTPGLKERYFFFDQSDKGYMVIGNPDLEPEESWSLQIGGHWQPSSGPDLDLNFFYNRIENLIMTEYDPNASSQQGMEIYNYQNLDQARTWGTEITTHWQPHPNWQLQLGYTWLQSEDPNTGHQLTRRPEHQLKGELSFHYQALSMSLLGDWQSREYIDAANTQASPAWQRWHWRASYAMEPFTLLAGIDNLFDALPDLNDHADLSPKPGRFIYLGLRIDGQF